MKYIAISKFMVSIGSIVSDFRKLNFYHKSRLIQSPSLFAARLLLSKDFSDYQGTYGRTV